LAGKTQRSKWSPKIFKRWKQKDAMTNVVGERSWLPPFQLRILGRRGHCPHRYTGKDEKMIWVC
jgi:hypothetical protein